jgi:hypothetical protein
MTGRAVPEDSIVRTALQLLPVPPHGDEFWARLERSLDTTDRADVPAQRDRSAVLVSAGAAEAGPSAARSPQVLELDGDGSLALVPPALRRTSNAVLLALAVAAVVVVALAGNTLLEQRDGTTVRSGDRGEEAPDALEALVRDAQPEDSTPSTMSAGGEDASTEAVLAWVADLGSGDGDAAWAAMGQISRSHFGSQSAFEAELSALAEGYGAWSAAEPDEVFVTPIVTSDDGTIAVVTLVGTVQQEGATHQRADAFPVRILDGEVHLEPFAFAGELELVVPESIDADGVRPTLDAGEELVIVVPNGAEAPVLRLDDGRSVICGQAEGTDLVPLDGVPGQRCSYLPQDGIGPGPHTFTAAFVGSDGASISAESLLFEAA